MQLNIEELTKKYNEKIACNHINLSLTPGVYGLLGANGAGKTTLMQMICGVLDPSSGKITMDNLAVGEEAYRDMLGYLPQNFGYYPEFTAKKFMLYVAALKGLDAKMAKKKIKELLELVDLSNQMNQKIKTFSGGMKQRLGIAQTLINDPKILVLDEPTAGLDPKERIRFRNIISKLGSDRIVILSTHIVSDVEYIASKVIILKEGEIIQIGTRDELLSVVRPYIWEGYLEANLAEKYLLESPILNYKEENGKVRVRIISKEKPFDSAIRPEVTLEDLYLYYFNDEIPDSKKTH